jgi:hypothetical protein
MNNKNQITSDAHRAEIERAIKSDPKVLAKGYC